MHGAHRPHTTRKGTSHPNYKHGNAAKQARYEHSKKMGEIRNLEAIGFKIGMFNGTRLVGRKPKV